MTTLFPAKEPWNPYTSPSLQIVTCNFIYTYYMLYIAIYIYIYTACTHLCPLFIFQSLFFFPEVLRNSVWFDGSKCDLDQSDGPLHQQNSMGLSCQLHTVETLGNLLDDRKLTDCFTGYFQEVWTCGTLCFTPPSSDVGLGNQTRKRCLERTHKEMSPCLGEEYCVQYHWRRTFHGIAVICFMSYSNEACFFVGWLL